MLLFDIANTSLINPLLLALNYPLLALFSQTVKYIEYVKRKIKINVAKILSGCERHSTGLFTVGVESL